MEGIAAYLFAFGLFLAGLACVVVEIFVIPGFGVVGVVGAVILLGDIVYSWIVLGPAQGLAVLALSVLSTLASIWLMMNTRLGRRFELAKNLEGSSSGPGAGREDLVGREGETVTPLRPTGVALLDGERLDVSADGTWIEKGTRVKVVETEGPRILVERVETETD